jgi:4-carboxymuconolactone decarboxylase
VAARGTGRRSATRGARAILLTARDWTQDFERHVHYPIALRSGIRRDIADAIAEERRPVGMNADDEEIVFDFAGELLQNGQVFAATFGRAKAGFGTNRVVELAAIVGCCSFLAKQLNVAQHRTPAEGEKPARQPRRQPRLTAANRSARPHRGT